MRDLRINLGFTYADTKYRNNLVGRDDGSPLNPALRKLPGNNISNAPKTVGTAALAYTPRIGSAGLAACSMSMPACSGKYNTGSDLFPQKEQKAFIRWSTDASASAARTKCWALELWAQNLFNKNYAQVAFNSPFQQGGSTQPPYAPGFTHAPFIDPQFPGGRQLFSHVPGRAADFRHDAARQVRRSPGRAVCRAAGSAATRHRRRRRRRPAPTDR